MKHAEKLIERILFLEGTPKMDEMSQLLDPQRSQAPMAGVESSPPSFYRQPLATVCARSDGVERSTLVSRDPQGSLRSASLPGSSLDWRSRPLRHWVPRSRRVRATQRCPSSHAVAVRFSTQEQAVTVTSCDLRFYLPSAPGVGGSPSPLPLLAAASASILSSSICLWSHVGISPRFSVRLQASPIVMLDSSEPAIFWKRTTFTEVRGLRIAGDCGVDLCPTIRSHSLPTFELAWRSIPNKARFL
jgi:hypothetical protein